VSVEDLGDISHVSVLAAKAIEIQVDQLLNAFQLHRTVTIEAPTYHAAADLCERSDLAMVIPAFLARHARFASTMLLRPLPCMRHGLPASMMWRTALSNNPGVRAIRANLAGFLGEQFHDASFSSRPLPEMSLPLG
jgi:DNA-binding transcriptional LysR family regulator